MDYKIWERGATIWWTGENDMRFLLITALALLLPACSVMQIPESISHHQAERQFIDALDEFSETSRTEQLRQFQRNYPNDPWHTRAESILLYAKELYKRKRQIETLRQDKERLEEEIAGLQGTNQRLTEKLEQLKGVLIEVEKQGQ